MSIRVNVVMGGPAAEHEISLRSGHEVIMNLDKGKYSVRAVVVTRDKQFYYCDIAQGVPDENDLVFPQASTLFRGPLPADQSAPVWSGCDIAFLALHGSFGEDGVIQGFLDTIGIPYTGSGVFASSAAMDKIISKYLFIQNHFDVPPYSIYGQGFAHTTIESIEADHGFPCFCKCPQSGSSRLMGKATDRTSLKALLDELIKSSGQILIERTIDGIEFSCAVLEMPDGTEKALPPIEIRPVNSAYFDYDAKYTDGGSLEIVPAPRDAGLLSRIEKLALIAHRIFGCRGISRTDMILSNDKLYVLETNTLPGLTSNSLLPKAFKATGGTYPGLLDVLIQSSFKKGIPGVA